MLFPIVLLVALPAMAQQSASYDLSEHVLNSGGHPGAGATPTSSSYQITLGSIGDPLGISQLSGTGYQMTGGFIGRYLPPGEVSGLLFSDKTTLEWNPDPAAIQYNLYSSAIEDLPGSYGTCDQPGVPSTTTLVGDTPGPGDTDFYLVASENRLGEHGTRGFQSSGAERVGPVCP